MNNHMQELYSLIDEKRTSEDDPKEAVLAADKLYEYLKKELKATVEQENEVYDLLYGIVQPHRERAFEDGFRVAQGLLMGGMFTGVYQNLGVRRGN